MTLLPLLAVVLAAIAPGLLWLVFFLRTDRHPEPKALILYAFGLGMLAAIPIVALQFATEWFSQFFKDVFFSLFTLAFIEELFKWLAAYFAVRKRPEFDEPVDAMIYLVTAAMGLATIENFFVLSHLLARGGTESVGALFSIAVLRFVGATLLHAISSGFVGYFWARGKLAKGFVVATVVHGIFNYLIVTFQSQNLLLVPTLFLVGASVVVFREFEILGSK